MGEKGLVGAIKAMIARLLGRTEPEQDAAKEFGRFFGAQNGPTPGGIEGR